MDATEYRIRFAALKAYEARAIEMRKQLEKNAPDMETEDNAMATLPDGTEVAKVTRRAGYSRAKVTDQAAFTDYVAEHHPEQIVMAVDPQFTKHMLSLAVQEEIPGTDVVTVAGAFTASLNPDAYDMIWLHRETDPEFAAMVELP